MYRERKFDCCDIESVQCSACNRFYCLKFDHVTVMIASIT